jgi:hypothetical protein
MTETQDDVIVVWVKPTPHIQLLKGLKPKKRIAIYLGPKEVAELRWLSLWQRLVDMVYVENSEVSDDLVVELMKVVIINDRQVKVPELETYDYPGLRQMLQEMAKP